MRHTSYPPQCDPCGAFLCNGNEVSYYIKMPLSFKFNGIFFVHFVHIKRYNVPLLFYLNSRLGMIDKICPVDLTCKFCLIIHNNNG